MRVFVLLSMLWSIHAMAAQSAADCSEIRDTEARLSCFDKQFPATKTLESAPIEPKVAESEESDDAVGRKPEGLFAKPTEASLQSRVKTVRQRDKQKMVFLLENDQIWMQSTPRNLPIHMGDIVTIKNTRFGGYMMTTDRGTSTRVKRIQ